MDKKEEEKKIRKREADILWKRAQLIQQADNLTYKYHKVKTGIMKQVVDLDQERGRLFTK